MGDLKLAATLLFLVLLGSLGIKGFLGADQSEDAAMGMIWAGLCWGIAGFIVFQSAEFLGLAVLIGVAVLVWVEALD